MIKFINDINDVIERSIFYNSESTTLTEVKNSRTANNAVICNSILFDHNMECGFVNKSTQILVRNYIREHVDVTAINETNITDINIHLSESPVWENHNSFYSCRIDISKYTENNNFIMPVQIINIHENIRRLEIQTRYITVISTSPLKDGIVSLRCSLNNLKPGGVLSEQFEFVQEKFSSYKMFSNPKSIKIEMLKNPSIHIEWCIMMNNGNPIIVELDTINSTQFNKYIDRISDNHIFTDNDTEWTNDGEFYRCEIPLLVPYKTFVFPTDLKIFSKENDIKIERLYIDNFKLQVYASKPVDLKLSFIAMRFE